MKGYIINKKCYIFPQEVGQLPSIDAEIIYVQEENIKAWKAANVGVADKIKKYNYNMITVNPKEWTGHKDDELAPVQTPHTISKAGEGIETISVVDQATAGETVTVTLVDPETYTLDLTNKAKQRIWINRGLPNIEYHQEGDNYTFTMPDYDISILVGRYNGQPLTVLVDGQEQSSIEGFSNILYLFDNGIFTRITDLTDVCATNNISLNLQEVYSFNKEDTGKTYVTARLNGTKLEDRPEPHYRDFIMPSEISMLEISTIPHTISKEGEGIETISVVDQATGGETVTVTLVDPETYTFDLANKEKQRIWIKPYDTDKEYHPEVDNYTFTMQDYDISILVDRYIGYTLTVTVDGQEQSSIEGFSNILSLFDNTKFLDITDLTDVCRGSEIQINLCEGYTFNTSLTDKIIVTAKFNGTNLEGNEDLATFNMPSENSTLEITLTHPQS